MIPDGIYFVHPDGCGWIAADFRDGILIDTTNEANQETCIPGSWAGVHPSDTDEVLYGDVAIAVLRAIDEGILPECATVTVHS